MLKNFKNFVFAAALAGLFCAPAAAQDEYDQLAKELSGVSISTGQAKIAILPFSYVDKRKSDGGAIVSERLTTRIVKLKKFQVIERQLLENVISEQHLEATGLVSAETAQQIGKILGVEAIVNGTLMDVEYGKVEVNARIIRTDTAEVVGVGSAQVDKIWSDVGVNQPAQAPQAAQPAQEAYQQPQAAPAPAAQQRPYRRVKYDAFIEVFQGSKQGIMTLEFKNNKRNLTERELGFTNVGNNYSKIRFESLETEGTGNPVGMRIVAFTKHWGFGWELSAFDQQIKKQSAKVSYNGGTEQNFNFLVTDYLKITTYNFLNADFYYRFSDKWFQPYVGMGIGLTINTLSSPYILMSDNTRLDDFQAGLLFHLPVLGVRFIAGKNVSVFLEIRTVHNTVWFDRKYANEADSAYVRSGQSILGVGYKFN